MIRTKFAAALAVTALGVGAASAADLAPYAYSKAPPLPYAVYNWAGVYVGGHVGGSWASQHWTNTADTTLFGDLAPGQGFRPADPKLTIRRDWRAAPAHPVAGRAFVDELAMTPR